MSKLFSRATVTGATLTGASLKSALTSLWDALNTAGLSDTNRATVTTTSALTVAQCGLLLIDATAGSIVLTLPASGATSDDATFQARRLDSTANTVTIQRAGTDTVNGGVSVLLPASGNTLIQLPAGAVNWRAFGTAASGANVDITSLTGLTTPLSIAQGGTGGAVGSRGFSKADASTVAFTKLTAGTAQIKAGTRVEVASVNLNFTSATAITMPTLTAGTDYAIYVCTDSTLRADANFSAPSGYTTANSRKIGGFHFAPGGNATARAGGDTTPAINEYSFWDLKFKPSSLDPRGMALVADGFWADIYLLGVDHLANGTSKFNVTIADGASPPKIPTKFGGNGTTAYGSLNWWEAAEVLWHHGKRPASYSEYAALAFGTTEASSGGTDAGSTILRAAYTSKWGVMLASGNMWQWGAEFGGGAAAAGFTANTGGRGSTFQMENAAVFGGSWVEASNSGSRCSVWLFSPPDSGDNIGSRGVCDHLMLE